MWTGLILPTEVPVYINLAIFDSVADEVVFKFNVFYHGSWVELVVFRQEVMP
jgi:hypothetical protein